MLFASNDVAIVDDTSSWRRLPSSAKEDKERRWPFAEQKLADSYLVDPASSHMLVSKIKPCKCKYELEYSETANGSLNQLWFI